MKRMAFMMDRRVVFLAVACVLAVVGCAQSNEPKRDVTIDQRPDSDVPGEGDVTTDMPSEAPVCGSGGVCPAGQTCCPDGRCYNLTTDSTNCGSCGRSCSPKGNMCIAGNCSCNGASPCVDEGFICCPGGGCLDPRYDRENCGVCGNACNEGDQCVDGVCGGSCEGIPCPAVPHGTGECVDTICQITACDEGWADGDGEYSNGCECEVSADDNGTATCDAAYDLGELHDAEPGESVVVEGFCSTIAPVDWYRFDAIDDAEVSTSGTKCDNFHVDVRFLSNPARAYVFDLVQANCTTGTVVCENDTEYVLAVDMREGSGEAALGECPCMDSPGTNANLCTDNSSPYFLAVKLAEGADPLGCDPYRIEISNGKYDFSP